MRRERNLYSQPGSERRPTTQSDRSREPFDVRTDGGTSPARAAPETERPEVTIDEVLSRLVIHDDRPIENLPDMTAPELKLIGRCVSLSTRQTIDGATSTYYYTGLVAAVTSAAVTLMYVNRYSETDFEQYKERERAAAQPVDAVTAAEMTEHAHNRTASAEIDQDQNQVSLSEYSYPTVNRRKATQQGEGERRAMQNAGSLAPAVEMTMETAAGEKAAFAEVERDGGEVEITRSLRPPHFRRCAGSVGPLPYVSFLRKSIHDVSFGRDPRSSFYSLFSDPEKRLLDMQFLRMFVRRYLVHTSEGNNPRQVPLYAFVTVRGACPDLDRSLVSELVREELPVLMKADEGITRGRTRWRRQTVLPDAVGPAAHPPAAGLLLDTGSHVVATWRAPRFRSVGVILFFTVAFAIYLGVSLSLTSDRFARSFVSGRLDCFIASIVVWFVAAMCISQHAFTMHIPLQTNRNVLLAGLVLVAGAIGCSVMTAVVALTSLTPLKIQKAFLARGSVFLCEYYSDHSCSGFRTACISSGVVSTDSLCSGCSIGQYFETPCYHRIKIRVERIEVPLAVFSLIILIAALHTFSETWKVWMRVPTPRTRVTV